MVELVFLEASAPERDSADLETHAAFLQGTDQRVVVGVRILFVAGALHQEVHAVRMRDHDNPCIGTTSTWLRMLRRPLGARASRTVDVLNHLVLCQGYATDQCGADQHREKPDYALHGYRLGKCPGY